MQVVLIDADNTLWDTDAVFARAQLALLDGVCALVDAEKRADWNLEFIRRYDQAVASIHHAHLRYPPNLLIHALALALSGVGESAAAQMVVGGNGLPVRLDESAVELILKDYRAELSNTPALLPTVIEALTLAKSSGLVLYVVTEGAIERQVFKLRAHGINHYFEATWELSKNEEQFRRLNLRFGNAIVTMIGDQLDRDVIPAMAAGCRAVWVPGRFRPSWNEELEMQSKVLPAKNLYEAIGRVITGESTSLN